MCRLFRTQFFWTFFITVNALPDLLQITKTAELMMFEKIIAVYSETHAKLLNKLCWKNELFNVRARNVYGKPCAL
jgi:hypothetical protein